MLFAQAGAPRDDCGRDSRGCSLDESACDDHRDVKHSRSWDDSIRDGYRYSRNWAARGTI